MKAKVDLSIWEFDPESSASAVPSRDPMVRVAEWVVSLLSSGDLRSYACQQCVMNRKYTECEVKVLLPAMHSGRSEWLRKAMTESRSLLLVFASCPRDLLATFEKTSESDELRALVNGPWHVPESTIVDLEAEVSIAGAVTIVGHDGQFIATCVVTES